MKMQNENRLRLNLVQKLHRNLDQRHSPMLEKRLLLQQFAYH